MSFTLEIRGQTIGHWTLTTRCLEQVEKLSGTASRRAVELLFGDEATQDGTLRAVPRRDLLEAVKDIGLEAKNIPAGFQMKIPPMHEGAKPVVGGGGVGGLLIDGKYYAIRCHGDYWTIRELCEGLPEPAPRYDSAEISTENFGTIKIWPKKSGGAEIARLAREIQRFLENESSDDIVITWG